MGVAGHGLPVKARPLNKAEWHRHPKLADLAKVMVWQLLRLFPGRQFVLLGDGGYASHGLVRFAWRRRLALVSLVHADANLYEPPARRKGGVGRPRLKGDKAPSPGEVIAASKPRSCGHCRTPILGHFPEEDGCCAGTS